ncbi:NAD(P)/FAD-dependent oxidoreductase [Nocardioides dongxiaopingii]|uniref:phytoene desaturase family protein n=1 Tax=Nocardioides sp. S-1144 TaxID=2582905 RepID=UPI00110ECEF4|nr:NAD(P)/FAD-dependent oxidoreductase [Nocardioides sp. S-1144]QCW51572.1 NAD(P)/FAD-dependent oxidoreductase [Nocardioides sp. S-1144]
MAHDAVVVGAGPNGLVAANLLVDAGWSVLVLEEQPTPGGAVRSDRELHPDFVQDTFSAFYPLAATSRTIQGLGLEAHGLEWVHAPAVLGHPTDDGWAVLHRSREDTAAALAASHPDDGERWLDLCRTWDAVGGPLVDGLISPFPPVRAGASLLTRVPRAGGLDLLRTFVTPVADLAHRFSGPGAGLLLAGNAGHADLPLHSAGSGLFGLIMTMLGQTVGFPVPRGGAGELTAALVRRFEAAGGELRCGTRVDAVRVRERRAVAVETAGGERHEARRAVVADVSAPALFNRLLDPADVPAGVTRGMRSFGLDPGTVKVDWALDGPVPWTTPPPVAPGTVHVADSVDQMAEALGEVAARRIPAAPFLLCGQMTASDPTRSPAGTESLWAYTHVPQPHPGVRDAAGDGPDAVRGTWDRDDCERFADRIQARLERHAPDLASRILARRVMGPRELEARDANLVGGAINGGTSQIHQELFFRPVPSMRGRPETGVRGLYLGSASAHPGGGVHGAPGANAARAAIWHHRLRLGR